MATRISRPRPAAAVRWTVPVAALALPLLAAAFAPATLTGGQAHRQAASRLAARARQFQAALDRIQDNATTPGPHPPVVLTAAGANAYFAQDAKLPAAIRGLRLSSSPGVIRGQAEIDFSRLPRAGAGGLAQIIFTGIHQVSAVADLDSGATPAARLTIVRLSLDGAQIPNFLIDLAIREFVAPKYPQIQSRTFSLALPPRVRSLAVGRNQVTLRY